MSDVLEMVAGRELDARVAERVMGWTDIRQDTAGKVVFATPPPYSTDIAAAFQVVEKILDRLPGFECGVVYLPYRWRAEFAGGRYVGEGDALPFAICRAALAATGAQP